MPKAALLLVLLLPLGTRADLEPTPVAPPPAALRARFAGRFVYAGGDTEVKARDAVIDAAMAKLFFVIRPFARKALEYGKPAPQELLFSFEGDELDTRPTGLNPVHGPVDGVTRPFLKGITYAQHFDEKGRLVMRFTTKDGTRNNVYEASPDGRHVRWHSEIRAEKLGAPLAYDFTYERK